MADWEAFQRNISDIGSALGEYSREKIKRNRDMEDNMQMILFKGQAEQMLKQSDPYQQALTTMMNSWVEKMKSQTKRSDVIDTTGEAIEQPEYEMMPTFGREGVSFKPELSPQAQLGQKVREAKEVKKAQMTEEINVKRQQYKKDLDNFLAIDDILQEARGEGIRRFGAGFKMTLEGVAQKGKLGQAVGAYDAVSKRLRVQLVRAAGDVGNINIVEQQAAEKLIPAKSDSKQTAAIKRAYLIEISKAIDSENPSLVKETLDRLGIDYTENQKDYSNLWE